MVLKIADKNKKLMNFRENNNGAVLTKGNRQIYLIYKSVNQGNKARKVVSKNSFNKLFTKGKKIRQLGSNVSYLKFD